MLVEKDISIYSICEHHFVPIFGKCHVAYIANKEVIDQGEYQEMLDFSTIIVEKSALQLSDEQQ